jgi:putative tricarboxylic transport membrane protein
MFAVVLARGSVLKAIGMIFLGMLLGLVGTDVNTGNTRFTFGIDDLFDGLGFVTVAMGVFGIAEIISNLAKEDRRDLASAKISGLLPTREDIKRCIAPILRGTALGGMLGILPGGGAVLASFSAYTVEKKLSATPEKFGTGMIEGVAAPESANNAAAQTSFIPMLTLGIPSNAVMAMMIGGMMIHGIIPGPQVMEQKPGLFWGMIVSMWLGNLMLIVLNLPLIGIWVRMLLVPYRLLAIAILFFCCIGVYSLNNSANEVLFICFFGVVGYILMKLDCEPAPLLLGFLLGPMMEVYMRRAMLLSRGDPFIFFQRPLSLAFLAIAAGLLLFIVLPNVRKAREVAFRE